MRQAVVLIHGIGEQKPMDTLRSFVNSIVQQLKSQNKIEESTKLRSHPDRKSGRYESRRLSISSNRNRPITDFYEFYWAHNMRDNKLSHFVLWIYNLMVIKHKMIPVRLKRAWVTLWSFTIIFVVILTLVQVYFLESLTSFALSIIVCLPIAYYIVKLLIAKYFLRTLGDAGRYLHPSPNNIGQRHNIRKQGLEFLKRLHDTGGDEEYDRIIIVGHSLGSVIAYDLLKILWIDYNKSHNESESINQSSLKEINTAVKNDFDRINISQFQILQNQTFLEYKTLGNGWKITDFISIGSPLYCSDFLITENVHFNDLVEQRETPTCPPQLDDQTKNMYYPHTYDIEKGKRTINILHHAALYAITRWTNIYFESDIIGGPLKSLMGNGIKDIKLNKRGSKIFPVGHTDYWSLNENECIKQITNSLKL